MNIYTKSVREDGSSIFARMEEGGVVYEIGKMYTFPSDKPAFVSNAPLNAYDDLRDAWARRPENGHSKRLLLVQCEAEDRGFWGKVLWCHEDSPYRDQPEFLEGHCTERLTVIGEIFVPGAWKAGW